MIISPVICIRCERDTRTCLAENDTDCERGEHCLCDDPSGCPGHCPGCLEGVDYCITAGSCGGDGDDDDC